MRYISGATLAVTLAMGFSGLASAQTAWDSRFQSIDEALRQHHWEAARQSAVSLSEEIAESGGGTKGDHRNLELGGAMAGSDASQESLALARACALRALAEAGLERHEESRWHFYLAQNLSRNFRGMDLRPYGKAGVFLEQHRLADNDTQHAGVYDVLDPVRPEGPNGAAFREPVRTSVVYPKRPKDLSRRDRFSHVVFIQITVDSHGEVSQPLVVDGGFYPGLIYRAFEALQHWRYRPATLDGRQIPFRYIVPVPFSDDGPRVVGSVQSGPETPETVLNRIAGISADLFSDVVYVADKASSVIYRVEPDGFTSLFAGTGYAGFSGDGLPAKQAVLNHPTAVSYDQRTAELFIADTDNDRIRVVSPRDLSVRTVAGVGIKGVQPREIPYEAHTLEALKLRHFSGDGGPAGEAELNLPSGVCADPIGILFIADSGNHRIRAVNRGTSPVFLMNVEIEPGEIQTIAGTGTMGFSGDGGPAVEANLAFPAEMRVDAAGSLVFVDAFNQRIRKIDRQSGIIRTLVAGPIADLAPERAMLTWSTSLVGAAVTASQDVIYVDRVGHSIHRISRGDGQDSVIYAARANAAEFGSVDVGPKGEIYVADVHGNRLMIFDGSGMATYVDGLVKPPVIRFGTKVASVR